MSIPKTHEMFLKKMINSLLQDLFEKIGRDKFCRRKRIGNGALILSFKVIDKINTEIKTY